MHLHYASFMIHCRNKKSIMYDILDRYREKRLPPMKNSYKKGATRIVYMGKLRLAKLPWSSWAALS